MPREISDPTASGAEDLRPQKQTVSAFWQGVAGSALLHGLILLLFIVLGRHGVREFPQNLRLVPVEIVELGDGAAGSGAPLPPPHNQNAPHPAAKAPARKVVAATGPRGVKPPVDALSAKLQALSELRASNSPNMQGGGDAGSSAGKGAGRERQYSLQDYLRAQVERRWSLDLTKPGSRNTVVKIQIEITASGNVTKAEIVEKERAALDRTYRDLAISARNAVLLSSPFVLPTGHYKPVFRLTLDLSPNETLR